MAENGNREHLLNTSIKPGAVLSSLLMFFFVVVVVVFFFRQSFTNISLGPGLKKKKC